MANETFVFCWPVVAHTVVDAAAGKDAQLPPWPGSVTVIEAVPVLPKPFALLPCTAYWYVPALGNVTLNEAALGNPPLGTIVPAQVNEVAAGLQTALMGAANEGQAAMVRLLIARGADVNARSRVHDNDPRTTAEPRVQWVQAMGPQPN